MTNPMDDVPLPEMRRLVAAANAVRQQRDASGSAAGSDGRRAERQLDALFGTGHTLAVYGTLAPGQPNHHVVAPLGGEWTDGLVEGHLLPECYTIWYTSTPNISRCREVSCRIGRGVQKAPTRLKNAILRHLATPCELGLKP